MNQMDHSSSGGVAGSSLQEQGTCNNNTSAATATTQGQQQAQPTPNTRRIAILPDHVVARIAAGEVVQRPVSVIKELLENALDAMATEIVVTISCSGNGGSSMPEMTMADNGVGMTPHDLPLAVLRHATSKLASVDDLQNLDTFGFRGEALSSVSMVASKLVICSRHASSAVAYTLSFRDGKPLDASSSSSSSTSTVTAIPQPTARRVGTTLTVHDLFYNLPLRQQGRNNAASSDYNAILHVLQAYAIGVAERGVGLICQKKKKSGTSTTMNGNHDSNKSSSRSSSRNMLPHTTTDWNSSMGPAMAKLRCALQQHDCNNKSGSTSASTDQNRLVELQQQATKNVIGMIHGARIQAHLQHFAWTAPALSSSSSSSDNSNTSQMDSSASGNDTSFLYQCQGYLAMPSFYFEDKNPTHGGGGGIGANGKKPNKNTTSATSSSSTGNAALRLILFINHRLVACQPLTRAVEEVYAAFSPNNKKLPFLYLHLTVPPHQVDVNVHPSKKLVTLLHLQDICQHLAAQLKQLLQQAGQAFCPSSSSSADNPTAEASFATSTARTLSQSCLKPFQQQQQQQQQQQKRPLAWGEKAPVQNPYQPNNKRQRSANGSGDCGQQEEEKDTAPSKCTTRSSLSALTNDKQNDSSPSPMVDDAPQPSQIAAAAAPKPRKKTPASQLIRTSRSSSQVGALEPFLVTKASLSQQSSTSTSTTTATSPQMQRHDDDCPLSKRYIQENGNDTSSSTVDLSQPGAFAILASQCQCFNRHLSSALSSSSPPFSTQTNPATMIRLPGQALVRPQAVVATQCEYKSIRKLRFEIQRQACPELQRQLRSACFVGVVSRERSLVQVGQDLILLNHYEAAREMFYQLALLQFKGGAHMANLGNKSTTDDNSSKDNRDDSSAVCQTGGIDIVTVIADLVETEDILGRLWHEADDHVVKTTMSIMMNTAGPLRKVSETNRALAEQTAACLLEEADLLKEYFSIRIERQHDNTGRRQDGKGRIVLSGMPVLLEGYTPAPHGLSLFLLRLATEVNWKDERQCFHDICSELGAFYATLPLSSLACGGRRNRSDDDVSHYLLPHVRHTIFPAISCLLVPPQSLQTNGHWKTLSKLSKLYKVFERC